MKKLASLLLVSCLVLSACSSAARPQEDVVTIEKTGSGGETIHVKQQAQQRNDNSFWTYLMFWHLFGGGGGNSTNVTNNYNRPAPSYPSNIPPPAYDEPADTEYTGGGDYNDSYWGDDNNDSYNDSFWDSNDSGYGDSFWDSGSDDFGGYDSGDSYGDSFWD